MEQQESKYYTPEIEEFHVGFEYEVSNQLLRRLLEITSELEWYKKIFDNERPYELAWFKWIIEHSSANEFLRVKYLDEEDIASFNISPDEYCIFLRPDGIRRLLILDKNGDTVFLGDIKNKSELKKLLKQLGI